MCTSREAFGNVVRGPYGMLQLLNPKGKALVVFSQHGPLRMDKKHLTANCQVNEINYLSSHLLIVNVYRKVGVFRSAYSRVNKHLRISRLVCAYVRSR